MTLLQLKRVTLFLRWPSEGACALPGDLSALRCSLVMFYFIALAGAHKRVVAQLREQLSLVRRHAPGGSGLGTPHGKWHSPRDAAPPAPIAGTHPKLSLLQLHSFTDSLIPSSCVPSVPCTAPGDTGEEGDGTAGYCR